MKITKNGYNFSFFPEACKECGGKCCIGESGNIWVNENEIVDIAKHLHLDITDFKKNYLIRVGRRYSLIEKPFENLFACIFFDEEARGCKIYDIRPAQCRHFPFWDYFLTHEEEVYIECVGTKPL